MSDLNPEQSGASPGLIPVSDGPLLVPALSRGQSSAIRLSVVIPTLNERKNLEALIGQVTEILAPLVGDAYELIVVDDDSPDRTWELALALSSRYPHLRVMRREGVRGLATAVIRGWQVARGQILGVIDGDLQHPPEVLARLWAEMEQGAHLAVGSRHVRGGGVSGWRLDRRLLSRGAQLLGLLLLPGVLGRVRDPLSGCFMVRRQSLAGVRMDPSGYKILIEVLARAKPRWIAEVGYVFRERDVGESKVTSRIYWQYLRHLLRLRLETLPQARFFRFACVGLSGTFVDMALLYLLSDPHMLGWRLTRSKLIAAELAIVNNFLWNDRWTFQELAADQRGLLPAIRRLGKFNLVCLLGLCVNVALLNLQFNYLGMNRYLANAVAILLVTALNFWLNLTLGWRTTGAPLGEAPRLE